MKKVFGLLALATSVALTACGGSSESSSYTGKKTLTNGNRYTCPSEDAMKSCTDDTTCAASCTLTYENVKPVDVDNGKTNGNTCKVEGKIISGVVGKSCTTSLSSLNGGKKSTLSCPRDGSAILDNGLVVKSGSISLNGYTFTCK